MQKILTKPQQLQIFGKELSLRDVQSPCNSCQKFAFWIKKNPGVREDTEGAQEPNLAWQ